MRSVLEFLQAYERLAEQGVCDTPGGAEYNRIRAAWLEAGRPDGIEAFIADRANRCNEASDPKGAWGIDLDREVNRLRAIDPEFDAGFRGQPLRVDPRPPG